MKRRSSEEENVRVIAELRERARWPETSTSSSNGKVGTWGPHARTYPPPPLDKRTPEILRKRVIITARSLEGLPYRHHHLPEWLPPDGSGPGLDCSNFTAWVYNFALGVRFSSDVHRQAQTAGVVVPPGEPLLPGDLIFIHPSHDDRQKISHVALLLESRGSTGESLQPDAVIIDAHAGRVHEHDLTSNPWYVTHFAMARRVIIPRPSDQKK